MKKTSILFLCALLFTLFSTNSIANKSLQIIHHDLGITTNGMNYINPNLTPLPKDDFFRFRYGILAGASYYMLHRNDLITINNNNNVPEYQLSVDNAELGIHFGIFSQLMLGPVFIRPEIMFNSNVINYKLDDLVNSSASRITKERYQYLDIPILVGFKSGGARVNAGPVGHIFVSNRSELIEIVNFSADFRRFMIGYQAGVGIDFHNLMFDLRYEGNLNKIGDGIIFGGERIYFSKTPGRLIASITFAIK